MDSDKPTDPNLNLTNNDVMAYMVGAIQRIESQLASDEPPPWAKKLMLEIDSMKIHCKKMHLNNKTYLPIL
jgi:hypothetical protein